jgi:hypothetical protein
MKQFTYLVFLLALFSVSLSTAQSQDSAQTDGASAQSNRAETVMKALSLAYPGRVGQAVFRNDDWAVQVHGEWFYYAQGRLLPEYLREYVADYSPQSFYSYSEELPEWEPPDTEQAERVKNMSQQRRENPPKRSTHFYDALWRASTQAESDFHQKSITFLGKKVIVHYAILEELALVEERIQIEEKTNVQVRNWVNSLAGASAWSWRNIAETESRSFHAYGVAIDLQTTAAAQRGLESYWLWTAQKGVDWWTIPYTNRQHPPQAVIKAFEDYGFCWGGKWLLYDTIHFEYRPEILCMQGMPILAAW